MSFLLRRTRDAPLDHGRILVTGASGGLGTALALRYARPGTSLLLWGRDERRLHEAAESCRAKGATVTTRRLDLLDTRSVLAAVRSDDDEEPIALAVLAAGLGDMKGAQQPTERPELVLEIGLVNFVAATVMATALAERMAARKGGRLVLIGSVAAFHALPFATAYCGSKAGLACFAEGLHTAVRTHGVGVTLVSLGFVDTPMSRRLTCAKPLLLSPETAAHHIAAAAAADRAHLVLPRAFALSRMASLLPAPVRQWGLRQLRVAQDERPGTF